MQVNSSSLSLSYSVLLLLVDGLQGLGGVNAVHLVLLIIGPEFLNNGGVGGHLEVAVPVDRGGLLRQSGNLQRQIVVL